MSDGIERVVLRGCVSGGIEWACEYYCCCIERVCGSAGLL